MKEQLSENRFPPGRARRSQMALATSCIARCLELPARCLQAAARLQKGVLFPATNLERLHERICLMVPDVNVAGIQVGKNPRLRRVQLDIPADANPPSSSEATRRALRMHTAAPSEARGGERSRRNALDAIGALHKLALYVEPERHDWQRPNGL